MRMKGFQALSQLSNLDKELDSGAHLIEGTDKFSEVSKRLSRVVEEGAVSLVYGSAVDSEDPGDIDVLVLQKEPSFASYQEMMRWAIDDNHEPKISLQIIPRALLDSFLASDPYNILVPGYSLVLNGTQELEVAIVSETQRAEMCKYRVGYQLMRAREALTDKFFSFYANSEPKTRSELKQARFARRNLMRAFGVDIPEVEVIPAWSRADGLSGLRNRLVEFNIQMSRQIDLLEEKGLL